MIAPRPEPPAGSRLSWRGFLRVADSWLDALTERSYHMLMGHFRLPGMRVFVINDPAWVKRMLVTEPQHYPKHRQMHQALEPLIGSSPFTTNGPVWRRQRNLLDQAFGHARLRQVFPLMQAACADMGSRLRPGVLDVDATMTHVTADIVFRTIFSQPLAVAQAQSLFEAFTRFQRGAQLEVFLRLLKLPSFGLAHIHARHARVIREFLAQRVQQRFVQRSRAEEAEGDDILAGLRLAIDAADGSPLDQAEVLDQVCMLFLAGHETSASALGWSLYLLAQDPALQDRLRREWQEVTREAPLKASDVRCLQGLHDLFREVLRLYPPVGYFPREATRFETIRGWPVRPGDALLVMPWLLHRHRRWWTDPDHFQPERFAAASGHPRGSYLPFGMGARACIGAGFAQQESALVLGELLHRFRLEPADEPLPRVVGRLTVRSDRGLRVRLQPL